MVLWISTRSSRTNTQKRCPFHYRGFHHGLRGKVSACNAGDLGSIPGSERPPLEKEMATHSSTLGWKIPWVEKPSRLQYKGLQRVGHHWATSLQLFIIWNWNAKVGNRNTWSSRQIWLWSTQWSRAKANRVLPRECTGHSKHLFPTTQEKTKNGHHQVVNTEIRLIIFSAAKDQEALYSQQKQD